MKLSLDKPTEQCVGGGGRIVASRGVKDTRRTQYTKSTKQDSQGLAKTEMAIMESAWICARSSVVI